MTNLLVINAHPKVDDDSSVTLLVLRYFLETYSKRNPEAHIEQIDLYREYVPGIDRVFLDAQEKVKRSERLTEKEQRTTARMTELLRQFQRARQYVIAMPLHNFNIPSRLKDYMDNILIPRETYKFTETGSVGLLNDGRSAVVIQGSGAVYTRQDWYTEVEYSHKYLHSMFRFLGFDDYRIIRAEGTALRKREDILAETYREAYEAAIQLAP
ncbi:FMN-dependent NADH-azoreductase [Paenibacillus mucilaginosus]|uniref:FMN dependent NADH:quinone oxidoreductase n=1 Tax=Paenibacillus mucilaginosus (strain KNP414) TaxID=1036673 RepID=F8F594_PAEMK|nr:NAD(P)H-dependent oxidoreductase [Paenibacillus mucilaginosus]AEI40905.1 AzoR1 [Paenibacillus mucilaginosus KNP414]MCG7211635.1 NAD(P)H-dependent oxidoreductase [Paenibacillus mucilaginosus]WDM30006.1 NAD(P)H-dependent oxidoreductase [Paenibacillus mucilaginosus]